jgi:hypothetical protein
MFCEVHDENTYLIEGMGISVTNYSSSILVRLSPYQEMPRIQDHMFVRVQQERRWKRSTGETKHGTSIAPQ